MSTPARRATARLERIGGAGRRRARALAGSGAPASARPHLAPCATRAGIRSSAGIRSGGTAPARARVALLALPAAAALCLAFAPAALAGKQVDSFIGGASGGTSGGLFAGPGGLAVSSAPGHEGEIYVADSRNHRVQRFAPDGTFERAWGADVVASGPNDSPDGRFEVCIAADGDTCKAGVASGGNATDDLRNGAFDFATGLAIDNDTGNVYVMDRDNVRVNEYDADGAFVRSWGFDVINPSSPADTGTGFEICSASEICKAGVGGSGVGQFSRTFAYGGLAVTPADSNPATGFVYVADAQSHRVQRFDLDGASPTVIGSSSEFPSVEPEYVEVDGNGVVYAGGSRGSAEDTVRRFDSTGAPLAPIGVPPLASGSVAGLKFDPTSNHLFVGRKVGSTATIQELDTASLAVVDTHGPITDTAFTKDIALNTSTGDLYVSVDRTTFFPDSAANDGVLVFDDDGTPPPIAEVSPATAVGAHNATFRGKVNPNGELPVAYHFEYSKTGVEPWTRFPEPAATLPAGTTDEPVEATVSGLEANTFYRVRLVATKPLGAGTTTSPEVTLLTDAAPPEVTTRPTQHRTDTSIQLLGTVNPNNLPTTYYFEWGGVEYGNRAPVPAASAGSAGVSRGVVEELTGLEPASTFHYRLCAENAQGTSCGADMVATTRPASDAAPSGERSYEMVTPPFKNNRRAAELGGGVAESFANPGIASADGEALLFWVRFGVLDPDSGAEAPNALSTDVIRRNPDGWVATSPNDVPTEASSGAAHSLDAVQATSADFETLAFYHQAWIFPSGSSYGTKVLGDSGGHLGSGWYDWLGDPDLAEESRNDGTDNALIADDGTHMVRWGTYYAGLLGPDDPARQQLDPTPAGCVGDGVQSNCGPAPGGHAIYLQSPPGSGPRELVNECTGSGADATLIPERNDNGTPFPPPPITNAFDDRYYAQPCEEGAVTSVRGGVVGREVTVNAISADGRRIFFTTPDPRPGSSSCAGILDPTGPDTDCPAQLFVRSYDADGEATVRWLSKPEALGGPGEELPAVADAPPIAAFGATGAYFEGASRDGRRVFFRTDAPLSTADSGTDWDLYRYELPADPGDDPTGPNAGGLTRITAGPGGDHPGTSDASDGQGGTAARYISDSGRRAYVATRGVIPGADNTAPDGSAATNAATGTASTTATRNLYLYDEAKSAPDRWKFIALLPFEPAGSDSDSRLDGCASAGHGAGSKLSFSSGIVRFGGSGCVQGTPNGEAITFMTSARLTPDDTDDAGDLYLYDAGRDDLTRVSAPPPGEDPYLCDGETGERCNADLGFVAGGKIGPVGTSGGRHQNVSVDAEGEVSVFFESRLRLVPQDTNGDHYDVYEWKAGHLRLVSPGDSADHSWYSGNSRDGRDAFIFTSKRISPREIDAADYDIYDARVGGGFPQPPPPVLCDVLGGACQGEAPPPPASATGSATFVGPGNPEPEGDRSRCTKLERKAEKAKRRAEKAKREFKRARRKAKRADGRKQRRWERKAEKRKQQAKRKQRKARKANRKARSCGEPDARRTSCNRLERKADRAKGKARRAERRADRARGKRLRRLERKADKHKERARKLGSKAKQCKRRAK